MFKRIIIAACLVIIVFSFVGCNWSEWKKGGGSIDYSAVRAFINQDYYENFDAKEYTLESFNLTNPNDFTYQYYLVFNEDTKQESMGERFFLITLKKAGKQYVQNVMNQLITLEFIDRIDYYYPSAAPGYLLD